MNIDKENKYASGEFPEVGDLVEFGTHHKRYIVTSFDDENDRTVQSGSWF